MNSNVTESRVQLEAELFKNLVLEVKETVAKNIQLPGSSRKAHFAVVDLWNIQRKMKSATRIPGRRL